MAPSPVSGGLGVLPQWRLEDLYESMESPRFAADLERARREAKEFAAAWRGKLGGIADPARRASGSPNRSEVMKRCRT